MRTNYYIEVECCDTNVAALKISRKEYDHHILRLLSQTKLTEETPTQLLRFHEITMPHGIKVDTTIFLRATTFIILTKEIIYE